MPGLKELILALDGKVARRSGDRADGIRPLHMVSAFLVREGLTVAQEPCDAKSNEITAIPRLLDRIHLEGAVVTIDAAGCQRAIVQALRQADADYVLAVKGNQRTLHRQVKAAFDDAERGVLTPAVKDRCETVERNGGRRERRICTVLGGPGLGASVADPEEWPGLRSLVRVQAERNGPRGRQRSVRHCITSRPRGRRGPAGTGARPLGGRERPAPHPGRAVPRGRLPHAQRPRARRHGHPAPGRTEPAAHDSTETRNGRVHRTAARPHRTPTLAPGRRTALKPTLRLPWEGNGRE